MKLHDASTSPLVPLDLAATAGLKACAALEAEHRSRNGQFLTPPGVARLLAGMFEETGKHVELLDAGAGLGSLSAAFVSEMILRKRKPQSIAITAWESERNFWPGLESVLQACSNSGAAAHIKVTFKIEEGDFLRDATELVQEPDLFGGAHKRTWTHAILNPPYRKIRVDSEARVLIRRAGLETSNLYTGFLWLAARLLRQGGSMVAITPRSFCNGPYFLPFRKRFFELMTLERVHTFERRDVLFGNDNVLQENLIIAARRDAVRAETIQLSGTYDRGEQRSRFVPYSRVLDLQDSERVIHLATDSADDDIAVQMKRLPATLDDLGLTVSTGRVVDFRAKRCLVKEPQALAAPLIYPMHFKEGTINWPVPPKRKHNALAISEDTIELLVRNGVYVLVKRFTSKEERRRVVAAVYEPTGALGDSPLVGFENHLNYFHANGQPMEKMLATGLALYLNSAFVDSYFRQFSGHTQVNAADLRSLRFPSAEQVCVLAGAFKRKPRTQTAIDEAVVMLAERSLP